MSAKKPRTIHDLDREAGDSDEQTYYAGGAERSGQLIVDPTKKKANAKQVAEELFKSAMSQGAQDGASQASSSSENFSGSGYSLGAATQPSQIVSQGGPQIITRTITFWEDGISIDDGPLLSYADEKNQQMLEKLKRGEVPKELLENQPLPESEPTGILRPPRLEVQVHLIDKKTEKYKPQHKPQQAFTGQGMSLGSASSSSSASSQPLSTTILSSSSSSTTSTTKSPPFVLDETQPKTRVSIRLANGQRVTQQFNLHTHTVGTLYQWVAENHLGSTGSSDLAGAGFELMLAANRSVLADKTATIQSAGLQEALVIQRLV